MTLTQADPLRTQYLTFVVGPEEYGVSILRAKEIIEYDTVTTVPNAPPFIRGVINLRGNVVPVVDLAVKFARQPSEVTRRSCIVVVEVQQDEARTVVGILADRVSQVAELPPEQIEPVPTFGAGVRTDWLMGLGRAEKRFILLLDTDRVLAAQELQAAAAFTDADPALAGAAVGVGGDAAPDQEDRP